MDLTIKSPAKLRTMDVKAKNPMPKCTSIDKISRPAQSAFGKKCIEIFNPKDKS